MNGIEDTKKELPKLKIDDETYVLLQGNYFQQLLKQTVLKVI